MSEFNRMTIMAAAEVVAESNTHSELEALDLQWGLEEYAKGGNKLDCAVRWARLSINKNPKVMTESGRVPLSRALIETAITANEHMASWKKMVAGLRFDGFELIEKNSDESDSHSWRRNKELELKRMLPEDVPGLNFREAESEVDILLNRYGFNTAKGHLKQAMSAFQRGEWSSANGELRNFFENYLNEIADKLGYQGKNNSKAKRDFLGSIAQPPFLFKAYNEWHANNQKPQYIQGLMSRMHPHGGHPGLSEEEDATFRLQINLITARLLLRRFDQRAKGSS